MSWLTPQVLQYGAGGLVGLFVLAILSGRLVPRAVSKALTDQANRTADVWERAAEKQTERADVASRQMEQLLSEFETIETLVRSLVPPRER